MLLSDWSILLPSSYYYVLAVVVADKEPPTLGLVGSIAVRDETWLAGLNNVNK